MIICSIPFQQEHLRKYKDFTSFVQKLSRSLFKEFYECNLGNIVNIHFLSVKGMLKYLYTLSQCKSFKGIITEYEENTIYVVRKHLPLYLYQAVVCNYSESFLPLAKLSLSHSQQL